MIPREANDKPSGPAPWIRFKWYLVVLLIVEATLGSGDCISCLQEPEQPASDSSSGAIKKGPLDQLEAPTSEPRASSGVEDLDWARNSTQDVASTTSSPSRPASSTGAGPWSESQPREESREEAIPRYSVDESTKLIYIDESNEVGRIFGRVESSPRNGSLAHGGPANYSLYLVSRSKSHIAILVDIEEVAFEAKLNCEFQELRFSIVGEVSRQLLERGNGSESQGADELGAAESGRAEPPDEDRAESSGAAGSPMPVSEAMALLLNAPLNRTILDDSAETNEFRLIDATIDYLHEQSCRELAAAGAQTSGPERASRAGREPGAAGAKPWHQDHEQRGGGAQGRHKQPRRRPRPRAKAGRPAEARCGPDSARFRALMWSKLGELLQWDDFKIVCGRTRRLVIPMRSVRLSVFSDEFAPDANFTIRFRFVSDPRQLPGRDGGRYFCRNRASVALELRCDGHDDCGDASDESVKVCGYPAGGAGGVGGGPAAGPRAARRRLTHYAADVLRCCQPADWLGVAPQAAASQTAGLQSFIGESMRLFSGPLFAPTRRRVKRIVGGHEARRGAWPGQASLQYELLEPLSHFCAGTLVHPQYVLTAGHCVSREGLARGIKVVLGAHDLRAQGGALQVRYVDDAQVYPGVDVKQLAFDWENDMSNDLALLRLNAPALLGAQVAPACLPPFNTPLAPDASCRSVGWGETHGSGSSNLLKHLSLRVVAGAACARELAERDVVAAARPAHAARPARAAQLEAGRADAYSNRTMVCVNNHLGHGICQGDSGGPLYCDRPLASGDHCTELYGVASFIIQHATVGAVCAVESSPGIFGEVSSKTEWIAATIRMFEQTYRLNYAR